MHKELDKQFFKSLKRWITLISNVRFIVDEKTKIELIVLLINKFIFIQTLVNLGVIDSQWLNNAWEFSKRRFYSESRLIVLKKFFGQLEAWFDEYYNIELFKQNILEHVDTKEDNITLFYRNIQLILGLNNSQIPSSESKGITHYNYRYINEDIFGKAYESYLAERHDKGIYYTPAHITEFIVEKTVGKVFDQLLAEIELQIKEENFEEVKRLTHKFLSIKILDPACGTGSFLIKALRIIRKKYSIVNQLIKNVEDSDRELSHIETKKESELISRIFIKHIYGTDLDKLALNIAKVNVWLEAIKLTPSQFRIDKFRKKANYILPTLDMNFVHGNAVLGLPDTLVFDFFRQKKSVLRQLFEMRNSYLVDFRNSKLVEKIENLKSNLRKELDENFLGHLEDMKLTSDILKETTPLHWALEFWHVFFNQNGIPLNDDSGFDVVIGNPPYIDSETMTKVSPNIRQYCAKIYESGSGNWDMFCIFIERGIKLTKKDGYFSYIIPNKLISADYADATRSLLKRYKIEILRDYSRVKVFDAAVYPIVLVINKKPWDGKDVVSVEILFETGGNVPTVVQHDDISLKDLYSLSGNIWSPALDPTLDIFNKIIKNSLPLTNYSTIRGAATVSESYEIAEKLIESSNVQRSDYLKFINTGTIDKYISLWGIVPTRYIKKTYLKPVISMKGLKHISEKRLREARSEKIIIAGMGLELECIHDNGEYLAGKSTVIVLTDKVNLKVLVGVLNSALATYVLRKMFGNLALRGGYVRIGPPQIREIPIPINILNSEMIKKKLEGLVDRIITLKKCHFKFRELWQDWSTKLKTNQFNLYQILLEDQRKSKIENLNKIWILNANLYPDQDVKFMEKNFRHLKIKGDYYKSNLRIYGVRNNEETLIYKIEFLTRELMIHVYLSILRLLYSAKRVQRLSHLFSKTEVPVIHQDAVNGIVSILKGAGHEFERWQKRENIKLEKPYDIIKCDNEIETLQAEIDAYTFFGSDLTQEEMGTIMSSLNQPIYYQEHVLENLTQITEAFKNSEN